MPDFPSSGQFLLFQGGLAGFEKWHFWNGMAFFFYVFFFLPPFLVLWIFSGL